MTRSRGHAAEVEGLGPRGRVKTYAAYWDETTAASMPAEVLDIYRAVEELTLVPPAAP